MPHAHSLPLFLAPVSAPYHLKRSILSIPPLSPPQVRVIIERLVRRCGVEPVAAACPPGDAKLLAHIRKQQSRKERRRAASEAGSQVRTGVMGGVLCWLAACTHCSGALCVWCRGKLVIQVLHQVPSGGIHIVQTVQGITYSLLAFCARSDGHCVCGSRVEPHVW